MIFNTEVLPTSKHALTQFSNRMGTTHIETIVFMYELHLYKNILSTQKKLANCLSAATPTWVVLIVRCCAVPITIIKLASLRRHQLTDFKIAGKKVAWLQDGVNCYPP
jgi:hypothetical protein